MCMGMNMGLFEVYKVAATLVNRSQVSLLMENCWDRGIADESLRLILRLRTRIWRLRGAISSMWTIMRA